MCKCMCLKIDHISHETTSSVQINYLSIHVKRKSLYSTHFLLDWHSFHSFGHTLFSSLSLPLLLSFSFFSSMVNFEMCNEMKIVERKKSENVSVAIISAVYMNKSNDKRLRQHVVKVRRRVMIIISLTRSHSWSMKVP